MKSPKSTTPLPQYSAAQLAEQPSPLAAFPSSQNSPGSRKPLPQSSIRHSSLQPSQGAVLASMIAYVAAQFCDVFMFSHQLLETP